MIGRAFFIIALMCFVAASTQTVRAHDKTSPQEAERVIPTPGGILIAVGEATDPIGRPIAIVGEAVDFVTAPIFMPLEALFGDD